MTSSVGSTSIVEGTGITVYVGPKEDNPTDFYKAAKEDRLFEAEEGKHKREQRKRNHIHWGTLVGFWVILTLFLSFLIIWGLHIMLPQERHFVTDKNLDIIQAIIVSMIGSSSLTGYAKNWLSKYED